MRLLDVVVKYIYTFHIGQAIVRCYCELIDYYSGYNSTLETRHKKVATSKACANYSVIEEIQMDLGL